MSSPSVGARGVLTVASVETRERAVCAVGVGEWSE